MVSHLRQVEARQGNSCFNSIHSKQPLHTVEEIHVLGKKREGNWDFSAKTRELIKEQKIGERRRKRFVLKAN